MHPFFKMGKKKIVVQLEDALHVGKHGIGDFLGKEALHFVQFL
jgi:hypothetical protein